MTGKRVVCVWCKEPCMDLIRTWKTAKGQVRKGYIHRGCLPQNRDKDSSDWTF